MIIESDMDQKLKCHKNDIVYELTEVIKQNHEDNMNMR